MEVKQIYEFVNSATEEALGESALVKEDLTNIVDVGTAIFNANALDKYVKSLVNHIGKVIFVNRIYTGSAPSVLMDAWEYGSVLEKVSTGLPEATENESWELENGTSYDPNIFYKPEVVVKFYNNKVTFEVPMSFTEKQIKQSFSSAVQLNAFISMLYTSVENTMTVKLDGLVMRTINAMIAQTFKDDYASASASSKSGVKAVNLLYLYNATLPSGATDLTTADCMSNPDFIRFAAYMIKLYAGRMHKMSTLFNVGGQPRFTSKDFMKIVMLEDFADAADVFLQSTTFHDELSALPNADRVAYWQGSGTDYAFGNVSKINTSVDIAGTKTDVELGGILCCMFDRYALGVANPDRRVTSNYNGKAEFYNNWYKYDAGYFNDLNENFVVFFVA